ncbi:hypothetical protein HN873_036253 [Arachis hypogaea]
MSAPATISSCDVCSSDDLLLQCLLQRRSPSSNVSSSDDLLRLPPCRPLCPLYQIFSVSLLFWISRWVEDNYASASNALLAGMTAGAIEALINSPFELIMLHEQDDIVLFPLYVEAISFLVVLIFPLLFPSLRIVGDNEMQSGVVTSLYLLCCILRILKIKDLANTIVAALFYPLEAFTQSSWG